MQLQVLGHVTVLDQGEPLALGGPKQRAVLALLIAAGGRPLSSDSLIYGLYGDEAADGARRTIHTYVSNLRREIGDVIVASDGGYELNADPQSIDAVRFESMYRDGSALIEPSPEEATTLLRDALGLWRGHAYGDVEAHTVLEAERVRLEELRLSALDARIQADLALGLHPDLIGELEALTAEYPLQESFRAHEMVALYRSGRQSEALRVFTRTRELLGEELGIDPSLELQELEQQILIQDPGLDLVARPVIERRAILAADLDEGLRFAPVDVVDAALARRNETLEVKATAAGGAVLDVRGTAVYAAFPTVGSAVEAARALVDGSVQLAIDFGDVEVGGGAASGAPVTRALRLGAVGHPGQVLVSEDAQAELAREGSGGWGVAALGLQTIRGLDRPIQVFQLVGDGLTAEFPELRLDRLPPPMRGGVPGSVAGYELRGELGGGVTGTVHRGYQATVGREVAVRVIRPELVGDPRFVRRFEAEAQRVAGIDHPHLVPLLDYWREPEQALLVSRFMGTRTLRGKVARSPDDVLTMLGQIGAAVAAAHGRGLTHGRIRPDNVFLDDDGYAYLADLGLAAMFEGMVTAPADAYTAPEAIGGAASPSADIYSLAVLAAELLSGTEAPIDAALPELGSPADAVIRRATHSEPAQRQESVLELLDDLTNAYAPADTPREARGRRELRNPYKGLAAFQEADAADFYGRSTLVADLVAAVAARPFTLVVGPSGIGKSSVVRGGLIPAVRSGTGLSGDWLVTDMFPGARPFDALDRALSRIAVRPVERSMEGVRSGTESLTEAVTELIPPGARLLLVIDQFEELFTHHSAEGARNSFLEVLTEVGADPGSPVRVVATMRADFLDRPLSYAEFGKQVGSAIVTVPALTRAELAEVVRLPANNVGVVMDDALVEAVVADAAAEPGALPLLQHSLTELFDDRSSDVVDVDAYRSTGGLAGAVGRRAEGIYTSLDGTDRATARELFLRLVSVNPDTKDTRRRVKRSELDLPAPPESVTRVIEAFGRHRLLVFDRDPTTRGPTIEVAHEALLTQWDRFAGWIDDAREDLLIAGRLHAATREWDQSEHDASYLLTGHRLEQATTWRTNSGLEPPPAVNEFIDASIERDTEQTAERRRRRRVILGGFAAAAVVALILALAAWVQRGAAQQEARVAEARELALEAEKNLEVDPELSVLLALEAIEAVGDAAAAPGSAVTALREGAAALNIRAILPGGGFVSVNHDGSTLVTRAEEGGIAVWDITEVESPERVDIISGTDGFSAVDARFLRAVNELVVVLERPGDDAAQLRLLDMEAGRWDDSVSFNVPLEGSEWWFDISPHGELFALSIDRHMEVWDLHTGVVLYERDDVFGPPAFSTDLQLAYVVTLDVFGDPEFVVVEGRTGSEVAHENRFNGSPPMFASFSPDGTRLAWAGASGVGVIDPVTRQRPLEEPNLPGTRSPVWFPAGDRFLTSTEGLLTVVDAGTGDVIRRVVGSRGAVPAYDIVPNTSLLASAGEDGATLLIDLEGAGRAEVRQFNSALVQSHSSRINPTGEAMFVRQPIEYALVDTQTGQVLEYHTSFDGSVGVASRNGAFFAGLDDDERHRVWSSPDVAEVYEAPAGSMIRGVSDDGSLVLITQGPARRVVRTKDESVVASLDVRPGFVEAFFSPDGAFVVTRDGGIPPAPEPLRIWDVESGVYLNDLGELFGPVDFSADGDRMILGQEDGTVTVFDLGKLRVGVPAEGAIVSRISAHNGIITTVRISPDNSIVASATTDEPVKLWDLETGESLGEFAGTNDVAVAFDPVRPWLYLTDESRVSVYTLDVDELVDIARSRLSREMTDAECRLYLRRACDA